MLFFTASCMEFFHATLLSWQLPAMFSRSLFHGAASSVYRKGNCNQESLMLFYKRWPKHRDSQMRNFHSARTNAALCHTGFWASRQWKCFHKSLQQDRPANTSFLSSMMRSLRSATGSLLVHANFFAEIFGPTIPLFLGKYPHFLLSGFILRCPFWSLSGLTIPRDHPSKSLVDRKLLNSHTRPFALML